MVAAARIDSVGLSVGQSGIAALSLPLVANARVGT